MFKNLFFRNGRIFIAIAVIVVATGGLSFALWKNNADSESSRAVDAERPAAAQSKGTSATSTPDVVAKSDSDSKADADSKSKSDSDARPKSGSDTKPKKPAATASKPASSHSNSPAPKPASALEPTPAPAPKPTPAPAPKPTPAPAPSTNKVLGVYWTGWDQGGSMTNVDTDYNLIYLFAAHRIEGTGNLHWQYSTPAGVQEARQRGQKVILSTGGAGSGIHFNSRAVSQQFVDSFKRIAASMGGVDGIDFNTFEADAVPNVTEYKWMAAEFKRHYGQDFLVTSPPAPWRDTDKAFCKEMLSLKLMDYCAPQYYDGPDLNTKSYVVNSINEWVRDVAGGDASKIVVGLGVKSSGYYMTNSVAVDTFRTVKATHPNIRGAFLWERSVDAQAGWPFANQMGPIVRR